MYWSRESIVKLKRFLVKDRLTKKVMAPLLVADLEELPCNNMCYSTIHVELTTEKHAENVKQQSHFQLHQRFLNPLTSSLLCSLLSTPEDGMCLYYCSTWRGLNVQRMHSRKNRPKEDTQPMKRRLGMWRCRTKIFSAMHLLVRLRWEVDCDLCPHPGFGLTREFQQKSHNK